MEQTRGQVVPVKHENLLCIVRTTKILYQHTKYFLTQILPNYGDRKTTEILI